MNGTEEKKQGQRQVGTFNYDAEGNGLQPFLYMRRTTGAGASGDALAAFHVQIRAKKERDKIEGA